MTNAESDIEDTKMSAKYVNTNSDDSSGEYEEAFEDIGKCPACEHKGPLHALCTYCNKRQLRYSILVGEDDDGVNKTDKENKAA